MDKWEDIKIKCPKLYKNGIIFECGLGWFDLIHDLSLKIEKILNENPHCHEVYATQVKEKYGTLHFYLSCETHEITNLVNEAEVLSSKTCENCGSLGKMIGKHWFEVKCDDCFLGGK